MGGARPPMTERTKAALRVPKSQASRVNPTTVLARRGNVASTIAATLTRTTCLVPSGRAVTGVQQTENAKHEALVARRL